MTFGNSSLQKHFELTEAKLKEARQTVKLFALDYDGTIYDGLDYKQDETLALIEKILAKGKLVTLITARATTVLKTIVPPLQEFLLEKKIVAPIFVAGGNGTVLHELKENQLIQIYNYGLSISEISQAVDSWQKVFGKFKISGSDLSEKGLETFQQFLKDDWTGYIPNQIFKLCQPYKGKIFTEEAKVTFVLPKDKTLHKKIIRNIQMDLSKKYSVAAGDEIFAHITKRLGKDGKVIAIKTILKSLELKENQIATFGDMPDGNDKGLLSFPYSFTNSEEFIKIKKDLQKPPFVLPDLNVIPIARVYKAIDYLLS